MSQTIKGSNDSCFRSIALSKHGKEILESIIEQVLHKKVEILEFIDSEIGKVNKNLMEKRLDIVVKVDGMIANVEVNTNDYIYAKFFRNFVYLSSLFNRYCVKEDENGRKYYDLVTDIIQINLNFGRTDIDTDELIIENRFGNIKGHIIENLVSYDCFIDNIKKFCYDNGEIEQYKYLLMLDMTVKELKEFYPEDKVIKEYGDALMQYNKDPFIYPYSEEEEKDMLYYTVEKMAYKDGVQSGIEQNNIENARKMKEKGYKLEDIKDITGLSEEEIAKL